MARVKVTEEQWAAIRTVWEADPTMSDGQAGEPLGVSKQAVAQRRKKEGWKKLGNQEVLTRKAYDKADASMASEAKQQAVKAVETKLAESQPVTPEELAAAKNQKTEDIAVDMRSKILERHRKELDGARNIVYDAIRTKDFDRAKLGKITSEALIIIQNGERKAWGFDVDDKKGPGEPAYKVIIERKDGGK